MPLTQRELHQELRARHLETNQRIRDLVEPLDPARLVQRSEPLGWSAGEVLEHLCVTDEAYDGPIGAALGSARQDAGAPAREWKPTLLGKMIAGMLEKPGKMKAPKKFQPGPTPRNGMVAAFLAREMTALKLMDDAASLDWRATRVGSPALPSWMLTMNLGDVFRIRTVHTARHARQIERVVSKL